jgi:hypothetical protein
VAKLLPSSEVNLLRPAIALRYANVVLHALVNRLKAEGSPNRTTEAGEELYFGQGGTTTASLSESTIPAASAGQDHDILKQDNVHPTDPALAVTSAVERKVVSQKRLAEGMGVDPSLLNKVLRGKRRWPQGWLDRAASWLSAHVAATPPAPGGRTG